MDELVYIKHNKGVRRWAGSHSRLYSTANSVRRFTPPPPRWPQLVTFHERTSPRISTKPPVTTMRKYGRPPAATASSRHQRHWTGAGHAISDRKWEQKVDV